MPIDLGEQFLHQHQATGIRIGQRTEKYGVYHTENGGVCPYPQGERKNGRCQESGSLAQLTDSDAQVTHKVVPDEPAAALVKPFLCQRDIPEGTARGSPGLFLAEPSFLQPLGLDFEVRLDLRVKVGLFAFAPEHCPSLHPPQTPKPVRSPRLAAATWLFG